MSKKLKILSGLLLSAAITGAFALTVSAETNYAAAEYTDEFSASESEELLMGYFEKELYSDKIEALEAVDEAERTEAENVLYRTYTGTVYATAIGSDILGGAELEIYEMIKELAVDVAAGNQESLKLAITNKTWTFEELGVKSTASNDTVADAVFESIFRAYRVARSDMPYEFYWDSRAASADLSYQIDRDNLTITASSNFIMNAASEYAGADASTVDTTKTAAAAAAAENAKAIVEEHASKSDYEKLAAYKDEICELVSYNFEAAESLDINTAGSNPFEIIYCFDGDPDTNIVCEGYSKAFMHLCNLSTFSGEVNCYVPTGTMDGGPHMWNIVTILGRNFLVDITNCDAGMVGNPDNIFLKGVTGSVQNGYTLDLSDIGQGKISYVYTDETIEDYGTGILTLTYLDYSDDLPAVGDASVPVDDHVIWANGGKNYKTAVVTPEIQATSWVNSKGKTQKTKLAWTTSLTAEAPLFDTAKHKVMTKSDKTVATASNGKITAKSGGETGEATAYVYVSDLGTMTSELHTVTVKNAPSSILLFDDAEKTDKKEALKKTNLIAGGEAIRVYITPTAKQGAVSDDCTYTISAKKNDGLVQFSEIKTDENGRLYFEVSALKVQKLGKVSKVSVAVACDQSGKKATLNVSIVAPVEAVGAEGEGAIAKKGDTAALALTFDVAGDSRLYTDKLQLVASASEPVVDSTGKKVTMTKSKEISAKLEKDGVTVTLKASKDVTAAQNVYVIVTDASTKLKTAHKIAEIGADGVITPVALS